MSAQPTATSATRPIKQAADEFLTLRRIAVTGVSRSGGDHSANAIYVRLRDRGYDVFAVNPNADTVEGHSCYADLASIPDGVDAVVIATSPAHADTTVRECIDLGIEHIWMHQGPAGTSVSPDAVELARTNGIRVIDGGCPLMFGPTRDGAHVCMRAVLKLFGRVPRRVA